MSVDHGFFNDVFFGGGLYGWCGRRICRGLVDDCRLLDRSRRCGARARFDGFSNFDRSLWFDIHRRIYG